MKENQPISKQQLIEKKQTLSIVLNERNNWFASLEKNKPSLESFLNEEVNLTTDVYEEIIKAGHKTKKIEHAKESTQKSITRLTGKINDLDQRLNLYQKAEEYLQELSEKEKYFTEISKLAENGYVPKEIVAIVKQDVEELKNQPNINPQLSKYISHVKKTKKIEEKNAEAFRSKQEENTINSTAIITPIASADMKEISKRQLTSEENQQITTLAEKTKHDQAYLIKLVESYPKTPVDAIEEIVTSAKKFRKTGTIQNYQQISGEKRRIERALDLYVEYHIPSEGTELIYSINRTYGGFTINGLAQLYHQLADGKEVDVEGINEELVELIEYLETNVHQENIYSDRLLAHALQLLKEHPGLTVEQLGEMTLETLHYSSWLDNPYAYALNGAEAEKVSMLIKHCEEKDPLEDIIDTL